MFTGIVDHCGIITAISCENYSARLSIFTQFSGLFLGESICVDGICLTITAFDSNSFQCDLSSETLRLTIAKKYQIGTKVNLERAMQIHDRLGGHIVTGHIDCVLKINKIEKQNEFIACEFSEIQKNHHPLLINKGSVCISGVSLTINHLSTHQFSVMLIPHTLQRTNLHLLKPDDFVNVEYDYLAKLIQKNIDSRGEHYARQN